MIGTPVKVDLHTLKVARGRFARMCVEIDLTKPVVGRVGINGDCIMCNTKVSISYVLSADVMFMSSKIAE